MAVVTDTDLLERPPAIRDSERNWAMLIHLSLYSFFLLNIFGFAVPFVLWLYKKKDSKFIDDHGKAALNFAITLLLLALSVLILGILFALGTAFTIFNETTQASEITPYALLFIGFGIVSLVLLALLPIFGVRAALNGKSYRYPIAFSFFK